MIPYRDDNPTSITPWVTWLLIAANTLIFLATLADHDHLVWELGFIPWELLSGERLSDSGWLGGGALWTSMFMHGGFLHLGGNMLFLWVFGNNVEDAMGHGRFLAFYLLTGLAAHAFQLGSTWIAAGPPPDQGITRDALLLVLQSGSAVDGIRWFIPTVGASGAIAGILAAYFMLFRGARVHMLIPLGFFLTTIVVPAGFAIGWWFLIQIFSGVFGGGSGGGVAWWAHIGGFVAGLVLWRPFLGPAASGHAELRRRWAKVRRTQGN